MMFSGQFSLCQPPQTILFLHGGSSVTTAGLRKGYWKRHALTCNFAISEIQQVNPSNDSISVSSTDSFQDSCFTTLAQKMLLDPLWVIIYSILTITLNYSQKTTVKKIAIMTFNKDFTFHFISHQILYLSMRGWDKREQMCHSAQGKDREYLKGVSSFSHQVRSGDGIKLLVLAMSALICY